jgi:hypothetical protein
LISKSGIRDEQPGSYFLRALKPFFWFFGVKIFKFFDADPGWRQFGSGWKKVGSGINTAFSTQKRTSSTSKHGIFRFISTFAGHFCPPGSGSNANP